MASLSELDPELVPWANQLVGEASARGYSPRVTSTVRTHGEQARLYRRFVAGTWPYPVAPPGQSAHEYGWAFDMVTEPFDALAELGALWESWGGTYGGSRDRVHFELPGASASLRNVVSGYGDQQPAASPGALAKTLAAAADFALGLVPGMGVVELAATLVSWGFPSNQVAKFLSGPVEYLIEP